MDVTNQLEAVFKSYCATGKSEMANKEFCKLNKECGLYDKLYTANDVDIIFAKSKPKTSKTLSYGHFEDALKHIAEKKKIEYEKLVESISSHGVQSYTGTKADYVKFHDDLNYMSLCYFSLARLLFFSHQTFYSHHLPNLACQIFVSIRTFLRSNHYI